jgi:membrane protease YdiL (CAAX protease family)
MTDPASPDTESPSGGPGGQDPLPPQTILERFGVSPFVFAILCLVFLFLLYQVVGGAVSFLLFKGLPGPDDVEAIRIVTGLGQLLLLFVPALLLVRLATRSPREYFRLRRPRALPVLLSLVGIVSLQQILQVYLVFQDKIPIPEALARDLEQYRKLVEESMKLIVTANSIPELLWVILVIAMIPAVVEEFVFRGLVQSSIEKGSTPLHGAVVTGIVFGAYHLIPSSVVPLSMLGVYLGFLAYRSNSLWVSVIAHFFNNAVACVATYLRVDDEALLTGDPKAMSPALLLGTVWFFGIVFGLSTYYFYRVTRPAEPDADGDDEPEPDAA